MLAFLAFMALRLKSLRSAEFLCQNGPHKAKKYKISISVAVALSVAFFHFSRGPWYLRSPVVYKNHVCEQYFPSTKNQVKIYIPVHRDLILRFAILPNEH